MASPDDEFRGASIEAQQARLKLLQEALGLNRTEFGARIGMAPQRVYNWENTQGVSLEGALRILSVYGVSMDWLLAGYEHKLEPQIAERIRAARERRMKGEPPTGPGRSRKKAAG